MATGRRNLCTVAAAIAAAVGIVSFTSGWIFHVDDREPSDSRMVGTVAFDLPEGRATGTAVLVDPCGILTNFHVVFGPWYVTALRPPSRAHPGTFTLTEVELPDGTHPTARATPVVWGDYSGSDRQWRRVAEDWAYLALDRCLGLEHGYFGLRSLDAGDLDTGEIGLSAIGYSAGRQMRDPVCTASPGEPFFRSGGWQHDCALLLGDSGGPIIRRGTLAVVALSGSYAAGLHGLPCRSIVGAGDGDPPIPRDGRCANLAVPMSPEVIGRIEAAQTATALQRVLNRLGYDAGPLGAIDDPRATAAIGRAERDMGWSVTGQPSDGLRKILALRLSLSAVPDPPRTETNASAGPGR
jgi:hypothetical protein